MTSKKCTIRAQAVALMQTCAVVLRSKQCQTTPDPRISALAVRILDAAKAEVPGDEILASLEIEKASWPVLLYAANAVIGAIA
jgi:hypothetical protein